MYSLKSIRNKTLEKKGSSFLVGYLLSGYKSCEDLLDVIKNLDSEGLDVFELGFPSDNPYADGKVIAAAHNKVNSERARSLEYWAKIRRITDRPIWVMAYCKDFIDTGIYKDFVKESLVDGLVIPDLDDNKRLALRDEVSSSNVDVIGFVNPGMEDSILDREL
ncbi:MAG: tryptophan synthase subunit alpha, partial [Sphaerochaetaceae bacterium]